MDSTSAPSAAVRNSPSRLSSFRAFHWRGLCEAVMMIPPSAPLMRTASSVVGVVARPMLMTSKPIPISVPQTTFFTISPEMRASRPTIIFPLHSEAPPCEGLGRPFLIKVAYAEVNFTMSRGFNVSPVRPPMVPRIPEIDFIKVMCILYYQLSTIITFPAHTLWCRNKDKHTAVRWPDPVSEAQSCESWQSRRLPSQDGRG